MNRKEEKAKINTRMVHIRLPEDIHKRVRVRAAESDTTIQDWVLEAIQEYLKPAGEQKVNRTEK